MSHSRTLLAVLLAGLTSSGLVACGSGQAGDEATVLHVYAASSLTATFEELGRRFEESHPGVEVEFSFAGSSDLVAQIEQGAPADVFAAADERNMAKLGDLAIDPQPFATNTLEIAVPADNPAGIEELADLATEGVQLVTCAPEVPCGAAAAELERAAGLDLAPVSEEQSVADVLGKVRSGEADAGLVYVTDIQAAGADVRGIAIDPAIDPVNTYPIAAVDRAASQPGLARDFVALVLGEAGQQVLADAGFGQP